MKKFFIFTIGLTVISAILLFPALTLAAASTDSSTVYDEIGGQLMSAAGPQGAALQVQDTRVVVATAIRYILGFVGIIFLALMVYAGVLWMTAGGNEEQVGKAKKLIFQALIGLIVIFSAYAITIAAYNLATGNRAPATCRGSDSGQIDSPDCVAPTR